MIYRVFKLHVTQDFRIAITSRRIYWISKCATNSIYSRNFQKLRISYVLAPSISHSFSLFFCIFYFVSACACFPHMLVIALKNSEEIHNKNKNKVSFIPLRFFPSFRFLFVHRLVALVYALCTVNVFRLIMNFVIYINFLRDDIWRE